MSLKPILLVEDIAEMLGISKNTIQSRRWRTKSGCPLEKKGKRLYGVSSKFMAWFKTYS
jgi:uncharacterized protein YjcR